MFFKNKASQLGGLGVAAILLILPALGCGKKSPPAPVPAPAVENSPAPVVAPVAAPRVPGPPVAHPAPPSQVSLPANATADAAADQLTMELRRYVLTTRSIPKTFEDFAAKHPMKFPPAPAGKHYAIEEGKIVVR